ncbi:MAG: ribonuclease P protein component [Candidatus Curtissbacteria bacterium]
MQPIKSSGDTFTILLTNAAKTVKPRIVISKKIARLAVDRNRIKRIFKEALASINLEGQGVTVIIKKNIAQSKKGQVVKEIEALLKKNV